MDEHRRHLRRYEGRGDARFLTCSCNHRLALFDNDKIKDRFVSYLAEAKDRLGFGLYAWVIMPEHFHLLVRPRIRYQYAEQVLRGIKAGFAKIVIARWRELDAPILCKLRVTEDRYRFWLPGGGYDRNVYSDEEFFEKLDYIHYNPVKRGLVDRPEDWAWSSARWYGDREHYVGPEIDPVPL